MPLRNAQAQLAVLPAYADREELGAIQAAASARFNDDRLELLRVERGARRRATPGSPTRSSATRRRRTSRCASSPRALKQASDDVDRGVRRRSASAGSRSCSATSATTVPSSYHTAYMRRLSPLESTYTKERATEICLQTLDGARLRPGRAAEHQARPRRPAAEVAARLRDRERPADSRPPDHARPGRPARLPGVPARGGPRAALRRLRPGAAVHLPPHLARPRADRDLLVHRRGDLARARVARALLRPVAGAGARERRGDDVPRGAALPPLRGEAALRARLLVALRRRRRRRRRLRGAA